MRYDLYHNSYLFSPCGVRSHRRTVDAALHQPACRLVEGISWGGRSRKAERLVIADRDLEFFRNFGEYRFIPTDSIWKA